MMTGAMTACTLSTSPRIKQCAVHDATAFYQERDDPELAGQGFQRGLQRHPAALGRNLAHRGAGGLDTGAPVRGRGRRREQQGLRDVLIAEQAGGQGRAAGAVQHNAEGLRCAARAAVGAGGESGIVDEDGGDADQNGVDGGALGVRPGAGLRPADPAGVTADGGDLPIQAGGELGDHEGAAGAAVM